jgi:aminomethyltransferase
MFRRTLSTGESALKKTFLYDLHVTLGGKMVDFAGWSLPVQYSSLPIIQSCLHTRSNASLFDVSHMQQLRVLGKFRTEFLERVTVSSIGALKPNQGRYTLMTNEQGGIVDDLIVTNAFANQAYFVVVNAACAEKDIVHLRAQLDVFKSQNPDKKDVHLEVVRDKSLIALQGPKAAHVLEGIVGDQVDLKQVGFFYNFDVVVDGIPINVSRSGYTGEDGFELSIPSDKAVQIAEMLLKNKDVQPAGLGARDVLRLEAGLCLYGHDMDDTTTPVEADLVWTISPKRRETGGFLGDSIILKQLKEGCSTKRVGLAIAGAPAREHAEIQDLEGNEIGAVTSGTFSPTLKKPIAMGFVEASKAIVGTEVQTVVRDKASKAVVVNLPFVPTRYYSKPKPVAA